MQPNLTVASAPVPDETNAAQAPRTSEETSASPDAASTTRAAAQTGAGGALSCWPQVLAVLREQHGMLYGFLANSKAYVTDTHVLIDAGDMFLGYMRENPSAKQAIKDAIETVAGIRLPIGPYKKQAQRAAAQPAEDKLDALLRRAADSGIETEIK